MRALLHYVMLKSLREKFLLWILFGPAILIGAPVVGLLVRGLFIETPLFPFALDQTSHRATMAGLTSSTALVAAIDGGIATFWIFRREIADRSITAFILAMRPIRIWLVAIAYAVAASTIALIVALITLGALTLSKPPALAMTIGMTAIAALASASLGSALASISSDLGMIVPLVFTTMILALGINHLYMPFIIVAVAVSFMLPMIAAFILERRCAA